MGGEGATVFRADRSKAPDDMADLRQTVFNRRLVTPPHRVVVGPVTILLSLYEELGEIAHIGRQPNQFRLIPAGPLGSAMVQGPMSSPPGVVARFTARIPRVSAQDFASEWKAA